MSEKGPWGAYEHLQEKLARKGQVDHQAWGFEAGLNRLLLRPGELSAEADADRAVRSESREERHRARLRRIYMAGESTTDGPDGPVDARLQLRAAKATVTPDEWALLCAIGAGYKYAEVAAAVGVAAGGLRIRVMRLRRALLARTRTR